MDTVLLPAGVFARMSPDDKRLLVELLGDGTLREDGTEEPGQGEPRLGLGCAGLVPGAVGGCTHAPACPVPQFLITAVVFNKGAPFRRPIYTNIWLLLGA